MDLLDKTAKEVQMALFTVISPYMVLVDLNLQVVQVDMIGTVMVLLPKLFLMAIMAFMRMVL